MLGRTNVASVINSGNKGSIAVATGLGAKLVESVPFYGGTALIYRYPDGVRY